MVFRARFKTVAFALAAGSVSLLLPSAQSENLASAQVKAAAAITKPAAGVKKADQEKKPQQKKQGSGPRMVAAMPMIIPGVDPKASGKLNKISFEHSKKVRAANGNEEVAKTFEATFKAIDELFEENKDNKRQPRTVGYILERKIRIYLQAIQKKVPNAEQQLNDFVKSLLEEDPKSDLAATATGMQLYFTKINSMEVGKDAEALIASYLEKHSKKTWSGRLVFMYSGMVAKKNGPEARLKWLESNISKVSSSDASQIKRQIAYARLLGSEAKLAAPNVEGDDFDIKQLRGKVVLIDFWATWCGPCIREMPEIKEVYEEYHSKGFEVISFSMDRDRDRLEEFLEENEYDWIQLYDEDEDVRKEVAERYGVTGIPATFLVDKKGKIVKLNLRGRKKIAAAVQELLDK